MRNQPDISSSFLCFYSKLLFYQHPEVTFVLGSQYLSKSYRMWPKILIFQSDLRLITSAWQGHGCTWSMSLSCGFAHFLPISERIPANIGSDKVDAGTVREMAGIACDWFCPFSRGVQWKSGLVDQRSTTHLLWQTLPVWPHTVGSKNQKKKCTCN